MRCKEAQQVVWESGGLPEAVRTHVDGCASCRSYAAELARVRMGFGQLSREDPPEPSVGFGARVLRRLKERESAAPEPLESAGRRVILATLVLVFTLLLAMILPSSGPVRHETTLETYFSQAETATATAATVSYASDWSSVPPTPVLIDAQPAVYRSNP